MNPTPRKATAMNTPNPTYSQSASATQSCHWPPPWSLQCRLMTFERPNYFCGHLLTDTDLTLQQRYFREKTRLYHRALDGHGIVCGLRLTCDHNCSGKVLVSRGYAIDNCGNDLIVAEQTPVDVISLLAEKKLILQEPLSDPGRPEHGESDCDFQQCFYLTIRYQEEETEFAAPLVSGCQPMVSECEPTRISETVKFDVVDTLPSEKSAEFSLKRRLELAFKIFSEGPFAQALQKHHKLLGEVVNPPSSAGSTKASEHRHSEFHKLFFELRGLLLLYFNQHPDKYNCAIEHQIQKIRFPEVHKKSEKAQEAYLEELRDAFSSLLAFAWQHAVSTALGELVPACHEVCEADPIYLGTVVVENGRLIRVCNCPRSYLWSLANFPEVLPATILGGLACEKKTENGSETEDQTKANKEICCRDFDFDLDCFLRWFSLNYKAPHHAGTELIHWLETLGKSFREGFDFTDPCNFSSRIFEGMEEKKAVDFLKEAEIRSRVVEAPLERRAPDLLSLLHMAGLATGEEPIVLEVKEGVVSTAIAEHQEMLAQINHLQNQISSLKAQVERLQAQRPQGGQSQGG
jgi:hypothetical protein